MSPSIHLCDEQTEVAAEDQGNQYASKDRLPGEWKGRVTASMAVSNVQNLVCQSQAEKLQPPVWQFWLQQVHEWHLSPRMSIIWSLCSAPSTAVIRVYGRMKHFTYLPCAQIYSLLWIYYLPPSLLKVFFFLGGGLNAFRQATNMNILVPPSSDVSKLSLYLSCTLNFTCEFVLFLIQVPGPPFISGSIV